MTNVIDFPDSGRGAGGGPEDSMLEQRVATLEQAVARIEIKIDRSETAFRRSEDALKSLADDNKSFAKQNAELAAQVARMDGRLTSIPTFWQTIASLGTLLIGISGLLFTASRFLHP